jgi:hypothetical protein
MSADSQFAEVWLDRRMTTAEGSYWVKDVGDAGNGRR